MSTTEYIIVTSTAPTYGRVSPEATVETMQLRHADGQGAHRPRGDRRAARAADGEHAVETPLAVQPREHRRRARAHRRRRRRRGRPRAASSAWSAPAARATSSRATSGWTCGSPARRRRPGARRRRASRCDRAGSAYSSPWCPACRRGRRSASRLAPRAARRRGSGAAAPGRRRARPRSSRRRSARRPSRAGARRSPSPSPRFCSTSRIARPSAASVRKVSIRLLDDRRREALGRLVHDQQPRVEQQRAADREHLLLAAGELRAAVPAALGEAREQLVDARRASSGRSPRRGATMRRCSSTVSDGNRRRPCGT